MSFIKSHPKFSPHVPYIAPLSEYAVDGSNWPSGLTGTVGGAWPAVNRALAFPFTLTQAETVYKVSYRIGTVAGGNFDIGVYDSSFSLLFSTGTTAVGATTATWKTVDNADWSLSPGTYYAAMATDSSSTTVFRYSSMNAAGLYNYGLREMDTAFVLPATFTAAGSITSAFMPLFFLHLTTTFRVV